MAQVHTLRDLAGMGREPASLSQAVVVMIDCQNTYRQGVMQLVGIEADKIAGQTFNCGFQNMSIMDIAQVVKAIVEEEMPELGEIDIVTTPSDDLRSYHINSDKIQDVVGFKPSHSIEDAVRDLCKAFKAGKLPDSMTNDWYYNVKTLQNLNAA